MRIMSRILLAGAALAMPLAMTVPGSAGAEELKPKPGWKAPRTSWGDPDLRGKWPLDYLAGTPRTRPASFGDRAELTDEEYAAAEARAAQADKVYAAEVKAGTMGMGHWTERGKPLRQASLQTEPNGKMPPPTEEGKRRAALQKSSWSEQHWDWVDDFSPFDLCITRGMPSSMLPGAYNMGIAIYQGPGYAVIQLEMIHEARIIPIGTAGGPPPAAVKGWLGYSRGHWEGDSLVIETTNFKPGAGSLGGAAGVPNGIPNSEALKIKERLTPIDGNTIRYEMWVEDPVVLTAPFKLDFPWKRNDAYELFEYACHEGDIQTRGFITATSTNPRLVAEREAKLRAAGLDPSKSLPFGITLAPGTAAPEQRINAASEQRANAVGERQLE